MVYHTILLISIQAREAPINTNISSSKYDSLVNQTSLGTIRRTKPQIKKRERVRRQRPNRAMIASAGGS